MSEILDFENTEREAVTAPEEEPAETMLPEEPEVTDEALQTAVEAETEAPDPFGPVNTGSIPLEVPAAADSGYVSPYSEQTAAGINRDRVSESGEPAGDRAGFWPRLSAFLIDSLVTAVLWGILLFVFSLFTDRLSDPFFFRVKLRTVLLYVVQKIYFVFAEWRFQRTLGKKALRIKVISSESFGKPDLWTVFFRETFGKFISSVCVVGDLMILGREHRPLYDRLADTEVVYTVNAPKTTKEDARPEQTETPSGPKPTQEKEADPV
ncbi:MAG: RDD family protein [Oscillospiraceae bacterium]|nr:RDD family protein [Oscillospiraceae bacterium]